MSESEPELGLATVLQADRARVQVAFPAAGETRTYASDNAPLKRVRFRVGDTISTHEGRKLPVTQVLEQRGLAIYVSNREHVPESELSDDITLHGPEDRLLAGRFDDSPVFELRRRTLDLLHQMRKSEVRGFLGGRIDLIPHQLYIAHEVSHRYAPRVMLSDEVGLGKTIEACLILHRLLLAGRAGRVLILVPESLVHQWFVEMLRKFNLRFSIFDEERCAAIESGEPGTNPFLDEQLVLASIDLLATNTLRATQAAEAEWDVLVVDEAHHLEWSPAGGSPEYTAVEMVSRRSEGLLLLTATPEQLGVESHFARLRLLDPERYTDLAAFQQQSAEYRSIAASAENLLAGKPLSPDSLALFKQKLDGASLEGAHEKTEQERREIVERLLDLHGPGRVLFRNRRSAMQGFPRRHARLACLEPARDTEQWLDRVTTEFAVDAGDTTLASTIDLAQDPRLLWLVELLRRPGEEKLLLICRSVEKAEAIDEALRKHLNVKMAVFHEGLTLLQRDRHAAWFADAEGARLLICSEIGSEGRNFQFAHHLVLFDLPLNPELLEQRIGRLDRIGQRKDIQVHVPYLAQSPQEVLVRWYREGLNAFEANLEGGAELLRRFGRAVHDLAMEFAVADRSEAESELTRLIADTRAAREQIQQQLEEGRDRLLEMNSFRPAVSRRIIEQIQQSDASADLDEFMLDVFEHYGVHVEELAPRTWQLNPRGIRTDAFPAMPEEGVVATCDRRRAVSREDVAFLTWDHPMVTGAMDLLLGSEAGNCAFAILPANERTLLLELLYVLEPHAAAHLHADRFLPATPIRVIVNHAGKDVTAMHSGESFEVALTRGSPLKLIQNARLIRETIPTMLESAEACAEQLAAAMRNEALREMRQLLDRESARLKELMRANGHVRVQELDLAEKMKTELERVICDARPRLDAVRLIWKGQPL